MNNVFSNIYKNKRVFVTGHTGFKGTWLVRWLELMGAEVLGYSLKPNTEPNHFSLINLNCHNVFSDIRDQENLRKTINDFQPDLVFHLAAQPLVRLSYEIPVETLETNIIGTAKVLEACRNIDSLRAIVNITSDKCYDNKEWVWGYRENDAMGGYDPYSASKGCAELIASSYRNSFFNLDKYGKEHNVLLASVRAGNVIGGGDWAADRLIPDIMKAVSKREKVVIRNPQATRPWQHVLEPLSGYLLIGQKLLEGKKEFADGWNFGPADEGSISVKEVVEYIKKYWDCIDYVLQSNASSLHEANLLKLDCSKAHLKLKWHSVWNSESTFMKTVDWYKAYYEDKKIITNKQLEEFVLAAKNENLLWAI